MRIQLTKEFRKVSTSYGLFQNLSGDANVELTALENSMSASALSVGDNISVDSNGENQLDGEQCDGRTRLHAAERK